jgi:L-malate glycosyltransferase
MKVIFLLQDTGVVYGAERATIDLARGLQAAGVECRALLIEEMRLGLRASALREEFARSRIGFDLVPTGSAFSPRLARRIAQRVRDLRGDILHGVGYKADVHGGWAAGWGHRFPVVATVHGWLFRPDVKERFYAWVDIRSLARMQGVVVLSRHYEKLLLARGLDRRRVVRIPTGLDAAALPDPAAAEKSLRTAKPFTVGMLGRLSSEKNHGLFVEAMRLLRERGVEVRGLIAGEGLERARIEQAVSAAGLRDAVTLEGYMETSRFFERVHVSVLCSRIENLPYSVLEAMAWCRPVVATRVGGLPDLVEDGRGGYLMAPGDAAALAEKLGLLEGQRDRALEMGRAGRQRLETEFTLDRAVARHIELYTAVAAKKNPFR